MRVRCLGRLRNGIAPTAFEFLKEGAEKAQFFYRQLRPDGLFTVGVPSGYAMPQSPDEIALTLRFPVGIVAQWESALHVAGDARSDPLPDEEGTAKPVVRHTIEDPAVELLVPAGRFRTVLVRSSWSRLGKQHVEEVWYASEVGVVQRRLSRDGKLVVAERLLRFEHPRRPSSSPEHTLRAFCRRTGVPRGDLNWVALTSGRMAPRSEFAVGPGGLAVRVLDGEVEEFDCSDPESVRRWVVDERWVDLRSDFAAYARALSIASALLRVHAAQWGLPVGGEPAQSIAIDDNDWVGLRLEGFVGHARPRLTAAFRIGPAGEIRNLMIK
ncbi:MAG: hypothetical protein NXI31_05410 [bacterium]|nr:hypothetical protein [bacterium]